MPNSHFSFYSLPPLIGALFAVGLGFFVLTQNKKAPLNQIFFLLCLSIFSWLGSYALAYSTTNETLAIFCTKIACTSVALTTLFIYHFTALFLRLKNENVLIKFAYAVTGTFLILFSFTNLLLDGARHYYWGYYSRAGIFHPIYLVIAFSLITRCFYILIRALHSKEVIAAAEHLNQIKYVFLAFIILVPSTIDYAPKYGLEFYPIGFVFVLFYVAIISYAVAKHKLMDIQIVIKKTAAYLFWILFVSVPYVALVLGTHGLVSGSLNFSGHLNWFVISSFACALLTSGLAVFAFFYGKNSAQRLFVYFNIAVALWSAGCVLAGLARNESAAIFGWRFSLLGAYFISPIFYHLTTEICETKRRRLILLFAYAQALALEMIILFKPELLLSGATPIFDFIAPKSTGLFALSIAIFYALVGLSFLVLLKKRKRTSGQHQRQINYLICGFLLGFVASACNMPTLLGLSFIYPIGNAGICVYALILAYAIFKHQLLDIRFVLKKAVFYTAIASFISFLYLGIIYLLHLTLFSGAETNSFFINFLSILIIAVVFKPVEIFFNRIVEKKFFSGTISQIAEAKERLETELERQERLRSVGILAAGMAHEIKNPLTAIKTFAEYLPVKGNDASFREKYSKIVNHEVARIQEIVTNLLLFSKPAEPKKQDVDVNELVAEIGQLLNAEMLKNSVHYEQRLAPSLKNVFVDRDQIKQVLLNIELNAIDAMKLKPGRLCVSTEDRGDFAIILIRDEGIGISQDKLPHIFDPFYSTKDHGTGLGLAVSYSILQKNKAKIEVESQEGTGSTFKIFLPALTIDSGEREVNR